MKAKSNHSKGWRWAWACLFLGAAVAGAGQATVTVTTNYYAVGGSNHIEIREAMRRNRPWANSLGYDARTDWTLTCKFAWREIAGRFHLDGFDIKTKAVIRLPRWIAPESAEPDLHTNWWRYLTGLARHEQGHLQIAREATAEVQRRLAALPSFASAQELSANANRTVTDTIEEFRKKERAYDVQTRHGATQGAAFSSRIAREQPPPDNTGAGR